MIHNPIIENRNREKTEWARHNDEHNRLTARLVPVSFSTTSFSPSTDMEHGYALSGQDNNYLSPKQARSLVDAALEQGHQPIYPIESPQGKFSYREERKEDPFAGQEPLSADRLLYKITSQYR